MIWPTNILVPVDFSSDSETTLDRVHEFIKDRPCRITILHVNSKPSRWSMWPAGLAGSAKGELHDLAKKTRGWKGCSTQTLLRDGEIIEEIMKTALEIGADLIAMSSHDLHGLSRLIYGSTAQEIVPSALCPVLVVRSPETGRGPSNTLVPVDFSWFSPAMVKLAADLLEKGEIELLYAVEPYTGAGELSWVNMPTGEAEQKLNALADEARAVIKCPVKLNTRIEQGCAAEAILRRANSGQFGLIVMGTHSRYGIKRFVLGSVVQEVLKSSHCPVLVMHPETTEKHLLTEKLFESSTSSQTG